jgi:hypothetical protein
MTKKNWYCVEVRHAAHYQGCISKPPVSIHGTDKQFQLQSGSLGFIDSNEGCPLNNCSWSM